MMSEREVVVVGMLSGAALWRGNNRKGLTLEGGDTDPPGRSVPRCDRCGRIILVKAALLPPWILPALLFE